jgi:hypothetical protein
MHYVMLCYFLCKFLQFGEVYFKKNVLRFSSKCLKFAYCSWFASPILIDRRYAIACPYDKQL